MHNYVKLISFIFLFIAVPCYAKWYETEGTATIRNGDVVTARAQATDDAIRQAMLESGSFVSTSQTINNGVYSNDSFNIASNNNIKQYALVSEKRHNGFLTVKIRIFMDEQPQACLGANYGKSILPVLFVYGDKQYQNSERGLKNINTWLTTEFTKELNKYQAIITKPFLNKNTDIDPISTTKGKNQLKTMVEHLARTADVQYVLLGVIRDISMHKANDSWLAKTFGDDFREISFDIFAYDGLTTVKVFEANYKDVAPWTLTQEADIYSNFFNNSPYGIAINKLLKKATNDLTNTLKCLKPSGRVIKTDHEGLIYINLGSIHSIKQGTKFLIDHRSTFLDSNNIEHHHTSQAIATYKVIKVFENSSILKAIGPVDGNIQVDDIALIE